MSTRREAERRGCSRVEYSIGREAKDGTDIENENEEEMMVEEDGNWRGFDGNDQGTDKV